MLSQLLGNPWIVSLAASGAGVALVWSLWDYFFGPRNRAEERLERLAPGGRPDGTHRTTVSRLSSTMLDLMDKATPSLAQPLQPKTAAEVGKLKTRLDQAGLRADSAASWFLASKLVSLPAGLALGGSLAAFSAPTGAVGFTRYLVLGLAFFFLPDLVLLFLTRRRQQKIFLGLPDALDLMVVCVESGLGLDQATRRIAEELRRTHPVVAHEFAISNLQLQMGRPRVQVLRELGLRNGERDLQTLASVLIQASKFGTGVGHALRVQSDAMRIRRRRIAEEKAAKCAVKLIFPLVLFIFPGIFVVLVGPAAISIIRNLFTSMP